jgi:hypothetical protein
MWNMSEGSLPPFGISGTKSQPGALKRALGAIFGLSRRRARRLEPDPGLGLRVGSVIGRHAAEHAALFERAERLIVKARRLEEAGTPSESANNRARRARQEVEAGLAALRDAFVASEGRDGGEAFDLEVSRRFPVLEPRGLDT